MVSVEDSKTLSFTLSLNGNNFNKISSEQNRKIMTVSRRLMTCRPRGPLLVAILTLPVLAMTWRYFQQEDTYERVGGLRENDYKNYILSMSGNQAPATNTNLSVNSIPEKRPAISIIEVNSSLYTSPEVFKSRQQTWMNVCAKNQAVSGKVHGVFPHKSGVLYCFVPKAGCTFWKQVFNYANAKPEDKEKYATPWDYPRYFVHNNKMGKGRAFNQNSDLNQYPMRVVVSRDPFSRVLSSFLDKFYLPDFWFVLGTQYKAKSAHQPSSLGSNYFTEHFRIMEEKFRSTYKTGSPKSCGNRLTFAQFLRNALHTYEPHWLPVHTICNPCNLKPTHVVHMDTFTSDARVIMKQMGLDHFLDGFDPIQQTNTEIDTIVQYNFDRVFVAKSRHQFEGCVSQEELAYRLWNNFQWKGFIHPDHQYVIPEPGTNVKDDLRAQLVKAREAAIKDPAACKKFKADFKLQAFKSLDKSLFEELVKKFATDSELFGYENVIEKMRALYT